MNFFNALKNSLPENISLVDEVAEVLNLSTDSAYRRLRGEKSLTLAELATLSEKFEFSIDSIIKNPRRRNVLFNFPEIAYNEENFLKYYDSIENDLKSIQNAKNKNIIYCANDISLFHIHQIPIVSAFKSYFWMKTTYGFESLNNVKFSKSIADNFINEKIKSITDLYCNIPSIEILNSGLIDSSLNQLKFCLHSGYLENKDLYFEILDGFKELILLLKEQAICGYQMRYGSNEQLAKYQLYINDIILSDTNILIEKDGAKSLYISCNAINYLKTKDEYFINISEEYLKKLIAKSELISSSSEMNRNKYFIALQEKIEDFIRAES